VCFDFAFPWVKILMLMAVFVSVSSAKIIHVGVVFVFVQGLALTYR